MARTRRSSSGPVFVLTCLSALVSCQDSNPAEVPPAGPFDVSQAWRIQDSARLPDSVSWQWNAAAGSFLVDRIGPDSIRVHATLPAFPGRDTVVLRLWTLGLLTTVAPAAVGGDGSLSVLSDAREIRAAAVALLSSFDSARNAGGWGSSSDPHRAQSDSLTSFAAWGLLQGRLPWPPSIEGLDTGAVVSSLLRRAAGQGWTLRAIARATGVDSSRLDDRARSLLASKLLTSADSASLFPPPPVRLLAPLSVDAPAVAGWDSVPVAGAFCWSRGRPVGFSVAVIAPSGPDTGFRLVGAAIGAGTEWNLSGRVWLKVPATALPGVDTLVVTVSDDSGGRAVARAPFRVVAADAVPPRILRVHPVSDTAVDFGTRSIEVVWTVSDDSTLSSVVVAGVPQPPVQGVVRRTVALVPGLTEIVLQASDSRGNGSVDRIRVVRAADTAPPVLRRLPGTVDSTVPAARTTFDAGWSVSDAAIARVDIDGRQARCDGERGCFGSANLSGDSTWVRIIAVDSAGNPARDSVLVRRLSPPILSTTGASPSAGQSVGLGVMPAVLGDSIEVSMDGRTWMPSDGVVWVASTTVVRARSLRGGLVSPEVSAAFAFPPAIDPVQGVFADSVVVRSSSAGFDSVQFARDTSGTWVGGSIVVRDGADVWARGFLRGVRSKVSRASYSVSHDTSISAVSILGARRRVEGAISPSAILLDSVPGLDSIVTISVTLRDPLARATIDGEPVGVWKLSGASGAAVLRVENGPSSHGWILRWNKTARDTVLDVRDGRSYKVVRAGGRWWMASNLGFAVEGSWCYGDDSANCASNGRLYQWHAALASDPGADSSVWSGALQGACPKGWRIPNAEQWDSLGTLAIGDGALLDAVGLAGAWTGRRLLGEYSMPTAASFWSSTQGGLDGSGDQAPAATNAGRILLPLGTRYWNASNATRKDGALGVRCVAD